MVVLTTVLALPLGAVLGSYALADDPAAPDVPTMVRIGGPVGTDGAGLDGTSGNTGLKGDAGQPNAGLAPPTQAPPPVVAPPPPPPAQPPAHQTRVVPAAPPVSDDDDDWFDDGPGDDDDDGEDDGDDDG